MAIISQALITGLQFTQMGFLQNFFNIAGKTSLKTFRFLQVYF